MNYSIYLNDQFNSLEISFDSKPTEEIRNALKALKFRWHSVKKVWYGYATVETVNAALNCPSVANVEPKQIKNEWLEKANAILSNAGQCFNGYMGGFGWEGAGSHEYLDITEINKQVKRMAKALYPDIKVSTRAEKFSGGCSTDILVSLPSKYLASFEEYKEAEMKNLGSRSWLCIYDDQNKYIGCELMRDHWNDTELITRALEVEYSKWCDNDGSSTCQSQQAAMLNEKGKKIMADINALVDYFNYTDNNAMVDFYNTNFYSFVNFNMLKGV